jgi:hypothetical protein
VAVSRSPSLLSLVLATSRVDFRTLNVDETINY